MWTYKNQPIQSIDEIPPDTLGFIYRITHENGKFYIGRKILSSNRKVKLTKKEKLLPENKRKTFKRVIKETDWKTYWGSNDELKADIKRFGEDKFTREILCFCTTKTDVSFYEMYFQVKLDVLFENAYNNHIANTKFFRGRINEVASNIESNNK